MVSVAESDPTVVGSNLTVTVCDPPAGTVISGGGNEAGNTIEKLGSPVSDKDEIVRVLLPILFMRNDTSEKLLLLSTVPKSISNVPQSTLLVPLFN